MKLDVTTMSLEDFRELIKNGDDSHDNQIRITKDGFVFLSQDVGARNLTNIAFRYETFDAGNDYVGEEASKDDSFIKPLYKSIIDNWNNDYRDTYIDDWFIQEVE